MVNYRRALPGEIPDVLDFINMVFSMAHCPHDFRGMLPKLYEPGNEEKSIHYIATEDDKIMAVVCVLPVTLCHKDKKITCGTIGSVSVHPYSRGKGYMKKLMSLAVTDMKQEHMEFSSLSGRRNRYQYYGYEKGGFYYEYRFIADNFRHCADRFPQRDITLLKITDETSPYLAEMHSLSKARSVFGKRDAEDFFAISKSWYSDLYAVLENNQFRGYVSTCKNRIFELNLTDAALTFSCLKSCFEQIGERDMLLTVYPHELALMDTVAGLYESFSLHTDDNYQIFDYPAVLQFYLDIKSESCRLKDGVLDFSVQEHGNYRISVEDGKPIVTVLENKPSLEMTPLEAISCIFSAESGARRKLLPEESNWFPLPLALCPLDKC